MVFRDLRAYCAALEARGLLHRVPTPVSPRFEVDEIAGRVAARGGQALLFERVDGHDASILASPFADGRRIALALGAEALADLERRFADLLGLARESSGGGVAAWLRSMGGIAQLGRLAPRPVRRGACQQVVDSPSSLTRLAAPTDPRGSCPRLDLALVVTQDPVSGRRQLGTGRVHLLDERRARVSPVVAPALDARPAAIVLGADPAALIAGLAPLPFDVDGLLFAGFVRRAPVEVVRCRSVDLEVPASAEYVLEGRLGAGEDGGTFELTCLTRREEPILLMSTSDARTGDEHSLGRAAERLFLPLVRLLHREIVDISAPAGGGLREVLLVSIRREHRGQAQKVAAGLFGLMPTALARVVIVLDADVDLQDTAACVSRITAEVDWRRDVFILDGPVESREPGPRLAAKIGIDATRKSAAREPATAPDESAAAAARALVDRKWASYGMPL